MDAIVLMNSLERDPNFMYLTGFVGGLFENDIIVATRKSITMFTNPLEYEIAFESKPRGMKIVKVNDGSQLEKGLLQLCKGKTVGINGHFLPFSCYKYLKKTMKAKKIVNVGRKLYIARQIKDAEEVNNIRVANRIIKNAIRDIQKDFKEGITEKQLEARFDYLTMKYGADETQPGNIISFGANAALPHHMPDNTKLKPNTIVLIDVGARYKNYWSDVTRTFVFKPDKKSAKYKKIMEMYRIVEQAQKLAMKDVKVGASVKDVHNAAANHINTTANGRYKGTFMHAIGHSVGIEVHDGVVLSSRVNKKLEENMVVTIEPGIYVVGFGGIRIEDDVLVAKRGPVIL